MDPQFFKNVYLEKSYGSDRFRIRSPDSRAELFFEYKFDFAEIFVKKNQHLKEHSKKIFNFQFFYFE